MLTIKKSMRDEDRERKKEYMRNYFDKIKKILNHLINRVEELKNVSLKK